MNNKQMQSNIEYLLNKYIPERQDLKKLVKKDFGCVKYILAEIDMHKTQDYADEDLKLIRDIAFYYA